MREERGEEGIYLTTYMECSAEDKVYLYAIVCLPSLCQSLFGCGTRNLKQG